MGMRPLGPHGKNCGCCVFTGRRRGNTAVHRWRRHGRASIRLQRARLVGFALGGGVQPRHGRIWPRAGYGQRVSRSAAARSRCARRTRRARRGGARLRAGGLLARCSSPCSSLLPAIAALAGYGARLAVAPHAWHRQTVGQGYPNRCGTRACGKRDHARRSRGWREAVFFHRRVAGRKRVACWEMRMTRLMDDDWLAVSMCTI